MLVTSKPSHSQLQFNCSSADTEKSDFIIDFNTMIQSSNAATAFVPHNAPMLVSSQVTTTAATAASVAIGQNQSSQHNNQIMPAFITNAEVVEEGFVKTSTIESKFENGLIHEQMEKLSENDSCGTSETISTFESLATVLVCFLG